MAARTGDAELGAWCLRHLEPRGDSTIVVGLGTIVMGFARHFAGLARVATGDLDGAAADFEQAAWMATANGADLWRNHATVELADVLGRTDRAADRERAWTLVDGLRADAGIELVASRRPPAQRGRCRAQRTRRRSRARKLMTPGPR